MHIEGWINAYFEQGMEGYVEWDIYDRSFGGNEYGQWNQRGMLFFKDGDFLTIYEPNEDTGVLFCDTIIKREAGYGMTYDRHGDLVRIAQVWDVMDHWPCCSWIPDGVSGKDWVNWFNRAPALRAHLLRE